MCINLFLVLHGIFQGVCFGDVSVQSKLDSKNTEKQTWFVDYVSELIIKLYICVAIICFKYFLFPI